MPASQVAFNMVSPDGYLSEARPRTAVKMGWPRAYREFAAWIGLVPRQTGTGGRVRQLGISKRGDAYLRTLLMHGARAIVVRSKDGQTWPWLTALLQRRPYSVAVAAVANKPARTIWAVLARGQAWRPGHGRPCIDGIEETTALKESKRPRE